MSIADITRDELPPGFPELGNTGAEMYDNTAPAHYAEAETGYAWARFLSALSLLLDPIADVTRTELPRWAVLADPYRCPTEWLPVLAQWAGIRRPDAMSEDALRDLIAQGGPGFWRGTKRAMIAAVRRFYPPGTADRFIYFTEKADQDPYRLRVFTYTFVEHHDEAVRQALAFAKPAGLFPFEYQVRVGQTWWMLNQRKANWAQVKADYANWYEVLHDEPLEHQ